MCNCQNNNHPTPQPAQSLGPSLHKTHYQSQPKSTQDPNQYPHNPFLPRSFTNMLYNYKVPLDTFEHNVDNDNEL